MNVYNHLGTIGNIDYDLNNMSPQKRAEYQNYIFKVVHFDIPIV